MPGPIIFETGNPTGESGWTRLTDGDVKDGVHRDEGALSLSVLRLKPRILKKPTKNWNDAPMGIGRKAGGAPYDWVETSWNSRDTYEMPFDAPSWQNKEFYFAPGDGGFGPNYKGFRGKLVSRKPRAKTKALEYQIPKDDSSWQAKEYFYSPVENRFTTDFHVGFSGKKTSPIVFADNKPKESMGQGGGVPVIQLPLDKVEHDEEKQYEEDDNNVALSTPNEGAGYSTYDWDTDLARKPESWQFPMTDKDKRLGYGAPNQSGTLAEPPEYQDLSIEDMVYPIHGKLSPVAFGV